MIYILDLIYFLLSFEMISSRCNNLQNKKKYIHTYTNFFFAIFFKYTNIFKTLAIKYKYNFDESFNKQSNRYPNV